MLAPRGTVESFKERQAKEQLTDSIDLGLRTVEVKQIVGSVNRWQDFDAKFRVRNKANRYRYDRIKRAVEQGAIMPPVLLYKVGLKYYVVDGNHRTSVAKEVGQAYIDAHVIEYLPPADTKKHLLWRERSSFERRTNLTGIVFTELGNYEKLLRQIEEFGAEESGSEKIPDELFSLSKIAQSWLVEIYLPVVHQIREERLLDEFTDRTEADLFLYATYHRIAKSRLNGERISYREALADFRPTPRKSLGEKIFDTISSLLNLTEQSNCPHGLILDEDGLVKITRDCRDCNQCNHAHHQPTEVLSDEDITGHRKYL